MDPMRRLLGYSKMYVDLNMVPRFLKPLIMTLDNVVNICPIIRLSRKKNRFCCMRVSSGDTVFKTIGPRMSVRI